MALKLSSSIKKSSWALWLVGALVPAFLYILVILLSIYLHITSWYLYLSSSDISFSMSTII